MLGGNSIQHSLTFMCWLILFEDICGVCVFGGVMFLSLLNIISALSFHSIQTSKGLLVTLLAGENQLHVCIIEPLCGVLSTLIKRVNLALSSILVI